MKRYFSLFIAAVLVIAGCAKENGPETPAPEQETDFTVEQTRLTQGSFSVRVTPADNENPYYFGIVTKKYFDSDCGGSTDKLRDAYLAWFELQAQAYKLTIEDFLSNALLTGMQDYLFRSLVPETDYVFFVFGVDYTGKATTGVQTLPVTTPKAVLNSSAKFSITPTEIGSTYFKVDIECSDPDIFYYYDVMMPSVYEYYCGSNPDNITSYMESYLSALKSENETYSAMSDAEFYSAITVYGKHEYDTALSEAANSLIPEMEYPVFAIGIANDGTFTTDPCVVMVKTTESKRNDWMFSNEKVTDIKYNITIDAAYDEVFATIIERSVYFEGLSDEQIVNELLAARKNDFTDDLYVTKADFEATDLIPDEDYTLVIIACTPDGQPKTGDKLNIRKREVKTKEAVKTGANYALKVYDISKTDAKVSISGDNAAEGQTYMINYDTKARIDALTASEGSVSAAYRKSCDEFLDAQLEAWNSTHTTAMDRKEFLSRSLLKDLTSGTYYSLSGLTPGTEYVMYAIGLKADGTYTTEAFTYSFKTVANLESKVSLSAAMTGTTYEEVYPGQLTYTIFTYANPVDAAGRLYGKIFQGTDEWAGKSADEILSELTKDENKSDSASYWRTFVNWTNEGVKFYIYSVGYDTDGIATDILKCSHTGKLSECGLEYNFKNVNFDKTETISVR